MTKATSSVYNSKVCVFGFHRSGCLVMKGRTTSSYSRWMLDKSLSTASGTPVPLSSRSRSSLDLKEGGGIWLQRPETGIRPDPQHGSRKQTRTWDDPASASQATETGKASSQTEGTCTHTAEPAAGGPSRRSSAETQPLKQQDGVTTRKDHLGQAALASAHLFPTRQTRL